MGEISATQIGPREVVGPMPPKPSAKGVTNNQSGSGKAEQYSGHLLSGSADYYSNMAESATAGVNAKLQKLYGKAAFKSGIDEGREATGAAVASVGASGIRMSGSALQVIRASQAATISEAMMRRREHDFKSLAYKSEQRAGKTRARTGLMKMALRMSKVGDDDA